VGHFPLQYGLVSKIERRLLPGFILAKELTESLVRKFSQTSFRLFEDEVWDELVSLTLGLLSC